MSDDMTLLRGMDGALFPAPGLHQINVIIAWEIDGMYVNLSASSSVMVTPPVDEAHAIAAKATLSEPDLLLSLAIGGDHLEEGNAALAIAADNDTLAPHFAVVQAKQLGRRFGKRKANPEAALDALGSNPVISHSEARRIAEIIADADTAKLKYAGKQLGPALKAVANGDRSVTKLVESMGA